MTARRTTKPAPAAPLRLFAVVAADGTLVNRGGQPLAHRDASVAKILAADDGDRVAEFVEISPAARETPWGEGQFDHVELAPGIRAALRVTPEGDVVLTIPGGELTITPGAGPLGLGILEAARCAAEIRVQREERARRRDERPTPAARRARRPK